LRSSAWAKGGVHVLANVTRSRRKARSERVISGLWDDSRNLSKSESMSRGLNLLHRENPPSLRRQLHSRCRAFAPSIMLTTAMTDITPRCCPAGSRSSAAVVGPESLERGSVLLQQMHSCGSIEILIRLWREKVDRPRFGSASPEVTQELIRGGVLHIGIVASALPALSGPAAAIVSGIDDNVVLQSRSSG